LPDLAGINGDRPTKLWMQLGQGDGNFGPPARYRTGLPSSNDSEEVLAADLNNDHHPEVLIGRGYGSGPSPLAVLLNDGRGHLHPTRLSTASGEFVAADVNGDELSDLLVMPHDGTRDELVVRLGTGRGTFGPRHRYAGPGVVKAVTADFNGDGKRDIAFTRSFSGPDLAIRFGIGQGNFGPTRVIGRGDWFGITTADVNEDGIGDILTGAFHGRRVAVWLGTGNGQFRVPSTFKMNKSAEDLVLADFDQDGHQDLLTDTLAQGDMALRLGRGDGGFGPIRYVHPPTAIGAAAADFNGDGRPDLVGLPLSDVPPIRHDILALEVLLNTSGLSQSPCVVPPLFGSALDVAEKSLRQAVCRVGAVTARDPSAARPYRVVAQKPTWGAVLSASSAVDLTTTTMRPHP
jgi:FG-GAP-like repeat